MTDLDELVRLATVARDAASRLERQLALNAMNVIIKRLAASDTTRLAMGTVSRG
jgi:hypothetical protein